jgi:hypothetical protein
MLDAGFPGTGTATDAVCAAAPASPGAAAEDFAGPRSAWGARIARAVHAAQTRAIRYPWLELASLTAAGAELALLLDEPYCFTASDGPEVFPGNTVALVARPEPDLVRPSLASTRDELIAGIKSAIQPAETGMA